MLSKALPVVSFLAMLLAFLLIIAALIVGLSLAAGWLVHRAVPAIDLGQSVVIGAIAIVGAVWVLGKLLAMTIERPKSMEDEDDEELALDAARLFDIIERPRARRARRPWAPGKEDRSKRKPEKD